MKMSAAKFSDANLYELLGIELEAEQAEIRKAYRKKALECHPDKNPDNPKAAELFHELSKALEILSDASARSAYDKVLKAKKASELRNKQLDSKRQKFKADLEQRERDALYTLFSKQPYPTAPKSDEEVLQDQIERLRREGSKLLEEEQRLMREQLLRTVAETQKTKAATSFDSSAHRIKIKWKAEKKDPNNGGYTQEKLQNFLKKYGELVALVMSKKTGSALVEFQTLDAAEMALAYEKGLVENPLQLEWVTPTTTKAAEKPTSSSLDYEDLVMRKLRQAEERKKLIAQMQAEDEAEG
ncbi:PREDICTED: dnaJ homolog subfamily C member 17 [Rhagoletis zephyria]|uniref:dnaJ homolog subfamily C member 17 n=1 Tax=Rhagoletis zephyria TaxID=28612 RepID=UPI0008118C13|nr:PREDICTED: dnaJ homolog subfamily C member 17 [Rhagoletis zephyria]XP_036341303.1 dnaJ homolog subfamily C member 17 [Rhagoletis pomonella]